MKTILLYFTACILLLFPLIGNAQLTVTANNNAQQLAQTLAGSGVTISNITITSPASGAGTFTAAGTNLGLHSGILLTTGNASDVPQAGTAFASVDYPSTTDADLKALTFGGTGSIKNKTILEFDVLAKGNNLTFRYVFGSEEYPEYVCSNYNDVFGFFISGNKPTGGTYTSQNIALIPNTTLPVAINTVNSGVKGVFGTLAGCQTLAYASSYENNSAGAHIVYDGFTKVLIAQIAVIPCQTYHLKLAIADVGDGLFDSGVFLEENSLNSPVPTVNATASSLFPGYKTAFEGCVSGVFKFSIPAASTTNTTIKYSISGSALNGTDYSQIPDSVVILAGDTTASVSITPTLDAITEGLETVVLALIDPCTGLAYSKDTVRIADKTTFAVSIDDSTLCAGQKAQFTATGGVNYTWSPAAGLSDTTVSNPIANPTATTQYTCSYTLGTCSVSQSFNVYRSNLEANAGKDVALCNTTSYQLGGSPTAANGLGTYTYVWSPAAGLNASNISNPIATVANTYAVTVTDGNNCQMMDTIKVQISSSMNLSAIPQAVKCFGDSTGSINLTVNGGLLPLTYVWNTGATVEDPSNLFAGNYTVTVKDAMNCSATSVQSISQPTALNASAVIVSQTGSNGANNGSINVTSSGGILPYSYLWNTGETSEDLSGLAAGTYTVTVLDVNNCSASTSQSIIQITTTLAISSVVNPINCHGGNNGSININPTGGTAPYTYVWSNGATTQNVAGLVAGTYTVTVKDAKNVSVSTNSITLTEPIALSATPLSMANVKCFGKNTGAITLNLTGGTRPYTFNWNDGGTKQNRDSLMAGTYILTVTDKNACVLTFTKTITEPTALLANFTKTDVSCFGKADGAIKLQANGGTPSYSFKWNNGSNLQNLTALNSGTYLATISDANGCTQKVATTVAQPTVLAVNIASTNVSCKGLNNGEATANVTGGTANYTYVWNNNFTGSNNQNLVASNYTLTVSDAHGCSVSGTTNITEPSALVVSHKVTTALCPGLSSSSITTAVTGGRIPYSFFWNDDSKAQNKTAVASGTYTVTVTDLNQCSVTKTTIIIEPAPIVISASVKGVACFGGNTGSINVKTFGGTPSYSYLWSTGETATSLSNLAIGNYTLTVTDANACKASTILQVDSIAPMVATVLTKNVLCLPLSNGAIDLTVAQGTAPYQYSWSNGKSTEDITNLSAGAYKVTVKDANGCMLTQSYSLKNDSAFHIQASPAVAITLGESTELNATHNAPGSVTFDWSSTSESSLSCTACQNTTATPAFDSRFTLMATDDRGCVAKDTVSVLVTADHKLWVPNAFTPNGDGSNDFFQVFGNLKAMKNFEIKIFDRWGEKVFESDSPEFVWDGSYKGALLSGVLIYTLETAFADGSEAAHLKGTLTSIR